MKNTSLLVKQFQCLVTKLSSTKPYTNYLGLKRLILSHHSAPYFHVLLLPIYHSLVKSLVCVADGEIMLTDFCGTTNFPKSLNSQDLDSQCMSCNLTQKWKN